MKKNLYIVIALLLSLSLVACCKSPAPQENTDITFVEKPDTLPTSGWVTSNTSVEQFAMTDTGVFYSFNNCLYYLDTATGYSVGLCSKPNCLHGESESNADLHSCDAYVDGFINMMFCQDDALYYSVLKGNDGYVLYARNLDGTGLREIATLCSPYISNDTSTQISSWVFAYGDLYYTVQVHQIVVGENNSEMHTNATFVLAKFDLSTGKEEELLRSEDELIALHGANDNMAIFYMTHVPTEEEQNRSDYSEYMKQFPAYLRLWHKESGGVSTLYEMDKSTGGSFLGFAGGKLHMFSGSGTPIYAYDLATGVFGKSDLPEDANRIWSEKYAGATWKGYYDLETGSYYTNEYDTMTLPAGIDEFGASPKCFGQEGFIVYEVYSKDHRGVFQNYVYFPFERLDDGIQLSDRIVFMQTGKGSQILQPEA